MKENKSSKVELKIRGNKVKLSLTEAEELKKVLNDILPEKEIVYTPNPQPFWEPFEVWCSRCSTENGV